MQVTPCSPVTHVVCPGGLRTRRPSAPWIGARDRPAPWHMASRLLLGGEDCQPSAKPAPALLVRNVHAATQPELGSYRHGRVGNTLRSGMSLMGPRLSSDGVPIRYDVSTNLAAALSRASRPAFSTTALSSVRIVTCRHARYNRYRFCRH